MIETKEPTIDLFEMFKAGMPSDVPMLRASNGYTAGQEPRTLGDWVAVLQEPWNDGSVTAEFRIGGESTPVLKGKLLVATVTFKLEDDYE